MTNKNINFHTQTVQHLDIIKVFYSPTDAHANCLKNNFKIPIKIGARGSALVKALRY